MESSNSHHHLQDQLVGSSSLAAPSCYGVGTTTTQYAWIPTSILNTTNGICSYPSESILSSRGQTSQQEENTLHPPPYSTITSMAPDLGSFHSWSTNTTDQNFATNGHQSVHDHPQQSRIKEELAENYYLKYTDILRSNLPISRTDELSLLRNNHEQRSILQPNDHAGTTKLLLKPLSSGNFMNKNIQVGNLYPNGASNGRGFSQIFPSINVSNLNQSGGLMENSESNLDMNLEVLDLLTSSRFGGNFGAPSQNEMGLLRDGFSFGFDHNIQQSNQFPLYGSNKVSSAASSNGVVVEPKRSISSRMEAKAPLQNAPKKSRLEARASCPPFKVRKEKLGDRIAALQQLVAPFGKTDTASVLMEAIGYIKFLQNQVETLSVPYMKASRNKSSRAMKGGVIENENEEQRDLKSRGLCLVPVPCLSYITDGGGAVWPPTHFGGEA